MKLETTYRCLFNQVSWCSNPVYVALYCFVKGCSFMAAYSIVDVSVLDLSCPYTSVSARSMFLNSR